MKEGIENALITDFHFVEDRGMLTFWIALKFRSGEQSVGGYQIAGDNGESNPRTAQAIRNLMATVGVYSTGNLAGKYVRIKHHHSGLNPTIGHIIEDRWWDIREELGVQ